jgi:outer membrane receptor protein involved in Fe transport
VNRYAPLCAAALALSSPSVAEAAANGDAPDLAEGTAEDIVVTANKRPERSAAVPATIASVSEDILRQAHVRDLFDITNLVPSFRVEQQQSSAQTNFLIRGFGNGDNNVGIEPSVGVFVDGVYRSRSAAQISDLVDVAQVDVIAGPQTTLFGKNASAGVISIRTNEPAFTLGGNVEASYGNRNAVMLKGAVTGPLSETVAVRLSGSYDRDDGYAHNLTTGRSVNDRNRWSAKGQVLWVPAPDFRVRIIADADRIKESCCAVVNLQRSGANDLIDAIGGAVNTEAQALSDRFYSNFDPTNDIKTHGVSVQLDYQTGPFHITSISAWRAIQSDSNQDADFTGADLLTEYSQRQRIRTLTQELRVSTDFQGPFNFLAGAYIFNERIRQSNVMAWGTQMRPYADGLIQGLSSQLGVPTSLAEVEGAISALSGTDLTGQFFGEGQAQLQRYGLQNDSYSGFIQANFKATNRLTITGGLNVTRDTKHYRVQISSTDVFSSLDLPAIANGAINAGFPEDVGLGLVALAPLQLLPSTPEVPNAVENGRTANTHLTWTARAAYQFTSALTGYVNASTGFKPSSINLSRDSRPSLADAPALVAANLAPPATIAVAGIPISTSAYGSRYSAPETSTLYEIGLKGRWRNAALNVSLFKETVRDFQTVIFTGTGFFLQNAGKQSNWGIEGDITLRPLPHMTVSGALAWYNPKYDHFPDSSVGDLTGTKPANIAPLSLTIAGEYEHPLSNGNALKLRTSWHHEGRTRIMDGLPAETLRDPITQSVISYEPAIAAAQAYARKVDQIDAALSFIARSRIEISAWVRNLTNSRHLIGVIDSPAQPGSISGYFNRPRTFGASVALRW